MRLILCLMITSFVSGTAGAEDPSAIDWLSRYDVAHRTMRSEHRPMLIFVKSDACMFCKRMELSTYQNPQVVQQISRDFVPAVVNSSQNPRLAKDLGVRIFPTTVIVEESGRIIDSIPGYVTADKLQQRLKALKVR